MNARDLSEWHLRSDSLEPTDPLHAEETAKERSLAETENTRRVLSSYEGRAFVWLMLQSTGAGRNIFSGEQPMTMSYLEGRRSIGEELETLVFTVAPETYNVMAREALEREQRYLLGAQGSPGTDEE